MKEHRYIIWSIIVIGIAISSSVPLNGQSWDHVAPFSGSSDGTRAIDDHPPTVSASADNTLGNAPLTVTFTANCDDIDGSPLTIRWQFPDDASVQYGVVVSHTFTERGTYTVNVTATDDTGLSDNDTIIITVKEKKDQEVYDRYGIYDDIFCLLFCCGSLIFVLIILILLLSIIYKKSKNRRR